jgi:DNA invertase Pin-like site-specific DNA recombinase
MFIGYGRVSTPEQKLDLQLDALHQAGCERIFHDVMTSRRQDRPGLLEARSHLRKGDTLIVWRFDRLARSVRDLIALSDELKAADIGLISVHDRIDTTTVQGQFFFTVMAACAQLERDLIVERTRAGLAAARVRGRVGGRPRKVTKMKLRQAMALMADPQSKARDVADLIGINRTVLYRSVNGDGSLKPLGHALLYGGIEQAVAAD